MRNSLRLALLLLPALCGPAPAAERIEAPSRWIGQVDADGGRFAWPGSGFEIRFEGTRLAVTLSDGGDNSLTVETDGEPARLDLEEGTSTYVLGKGLADGPHVVRVHRRTEGQFGATTLSAAETDGAFLPAAEQPERRVLVIGDSISAGYGIEGKDESCGFSAETENHYLTYAALAARALGAELTTLAISGRGLVRNYGDAGGGLMPDRIDRAIPTEPEPAEPRPAADVVIVHLGTNDFSGGHEPAGFEAAYEALLARLRAGNPDAIIYAAIGPGADVDVAGAAIETVVERLGAAGDAAVKFLPLQEASGSYGCDWHPNAATHRLMADRLIAAIESDTSWTSP